MDSIAKKLTDPSTLNRRVNGKAYSLTTHALRQLVMNWRKTECIFRISDHEFARAAG
jgi:hypothetical protein